MGDTSMLLAFSAGLVSFLSPCVLPVVPAYLTVITGSSLNELAEAGSPLSSGLVRHALLFIAGFSIINVLLGGSIGFLAGFLIVSGRVFEVVGGVLLLAFGILLLRVVRWPWANREWSLRLKERPVGNVASLLAGVVFAVAWTPCRGPIIGSILTLAATGDSPVRGMVLLGGYSAGLAVPFLAVAVGVSHFLALRGRIRPWLPWIERGSGVLLIVFGLLLVTGEFTRITAMLAEATPRWLVERM